jgi:hypothetical protein
MSKRKIVGQSAELRESRADRIGKAAFAQVKADTQQMRAKTERLQALRLAAAAERTKLDPARHSTT